MGTLELLRRTLLPVSGILLMGVVTCVLFLYHFIRVLL